MSATLLLADDSITIQRVIELTFADEQVRVVTAIDGRVAIQKIAAEPPDIVLADVGMPNVDGYGVAAYVKQSPALRHIPVLLLTGAFEPIDEAKARATGCDGVLVKPFEPQLLISRVRELLAGERSRDLWPADLPRVDAPAEAQAAPAVLAPAVPKAGSVPGPPAISEALLSLLAPDEPDEPSALPAPPPAARRISLVPPLRTIESPSRAGPVPTSPLVPSPAHDAMPSSQDDTLRPASRNPPPQSRNRQPQRDLPPPADAFESELDMLDLALSRTEPTTRGHHLDADVASDFARDIEALRGGPSGDNAPAAAEAGRAAARPAFGDWDLPLSAAPLSDPEHLTSSLGVPETASIDLIADAPPADVVAAPAPPVQPVPVVAPPAPVQVVAPPASVEVVAPPALAAAPTPPEPLLPALPAAVPVPPAPRPSLANAFAALLAAERAQPPARALAASPPVAPAVTEAVIEEVVKRVLSRMTEGAVHKVVLDAAERIIREEIAHIKDPADPSNRSGH